MQMTIQWDRTVRLKVLNTALNTQVQSDKSVSSKVRTNKYQNKLCDQDCCLWKTWKCRQISQLTGNMIKKFRQNN